MTCLKNQPPVVTMKRLVVKYAMTIILQFLKDIFLFNVSKAFDKSKITPIAVSPASNNES